MKFSQEFQEVPVKYRIKVSRLDKNFEILENYHPQKNFRLCSTLIAHAHMYIRLHTKGFQETKYSCVNEYRARHSAQCVFLIIIYSDLDHVRLLKFYINIGERQVLFQQ